MKRISYCFMFVFAVITMCFGQKTLLNTGSIHDGWTLPDYQGKRFRVTCVEIDRMVNQTYVTIEVITTKKLRELKPPICSPQIRGANWCSCIKYIGGCGDREDYGYYITDDGQFGVYSGDGNPNYPVVWKNVDAGIIHWYTLVFNTVIPYGINKIEIDCAGGLCSFHSTEILKCTITNPMPDINNINMTESEIKNDIDKQHDGVSGIYEMLERDGLRLACIKHDGIYKIIYLSGGRINGWKRGEIKATLSKTSDPRLFKAVWYDEYKQIEKEMVLIRFEELTMEVKIGDEITGYFQMYPIDPIDDNINETWTGTGFAIGNGYIVTNNHVAEEAKTIRVRGVKGDVNTSYTAEVVTTDKVNDIAILKIKDNQFTGFGTIPYAIQQRMADVGEDVFVLGYPLTQALGNEIKLTNGIISSRTGYQGNISTYQMSAPVQPGNSGGPMFDNKGNVIGIVVAGVPGAENVGYAIKTSYLNILIESAGLNIKLPTNNTISSLSLAEKVKRVKDYVFYIECSK